MLRCGHLPTRVELDPMGRPGAGHRTRKRAAIRRKRSRIQAAKHAQQSKCGPVTITKPDGTVIVQPART